VLAVLLVEKKALELGGVMEHEWVEKLAIETAGMWVKVLGGE